METSKYISISGGGTKGILYMGALDALENHFHLLGISYEEWRRQLLGVSGTSAGSLCSLFILLGTSKGARDKFISILNDIRNIMPCPDITLMLTSYGCEKGTTFREHIENILSSSGLKADTTMGDLKRLLGKEFICVCSDLQTQKPVYLGSTNTPNVKVCDAIYMSCSIPFLFTPIKHEGHLMVDGSLTSDLPMVFPKEETLFFNIPKIKTVDAINSWVDYIHCLLNFSIYVQEKNRDIDEKNIIHFFQSNYISQQPSFDININEKMVKMMISSGYSIVINKLTNNKVTMLVSELLTIIVNIMQMDDLSYDDVL